MAAKQATRNAAQLAAQRSISFEQAATRYAAAHEAEWSNKKWRKQFLSSLQTYVFPTLGALDVQQVNVSGVLRCIEPNWHRIPATAGRVRRRIEAVLDWARARELRTGDNPAAWSRLKHLLAAGEKVKAV